MKKLTLILCLLALSACAPTRTVLMKNTQTGDVRECKTDPWKDWPWQEKAVLDDCKEKHEKAGYVEVK